MMQNLLTNYQFLAPNPKSAYRQLFVKGTRIPARTLYGLFVSAESLSAEAIASDYNLPVEAVREAIAYCESSPPELADDFRRDQLLLQASGMNQPNYQHQPTPALLTPQELSRINHA